MGKETGKKIKAFIKNPGKRMFIFYAALLVVSIAAAITVSFSSRLAATILYAVAFVLFICCIVVSVNPVKRVLGKNKYTARYMQDYTFRTIVNSSMSCAVNFIYAAIALNLSDSSLYISVFANYYLLLGAMRAMLILAHLRIEKNTPEDKKVAAKYRIILTCGILLIIMSGVLYAAINYLLSNDVQYNYRQSTIVLSVIFAIYKVGLAIYNIGKAVKHRDYLTVAMRDLTFADTLVSMFVLASALVHMFGNTLSFMNSMNVLFGSVICTLTIVIGITMIVSSVRGLRGKIPRYIAESMPDSDDKNDAGGQEGKM